MDLGSHKHYVAISAQWVFLFLAKRNLQTFLNNRVVDYNATLDLCENEMMSIKFFGICKESMISVENLGIEKWYKVGTLHLLHGIVTI